MVSTRSTCPYCGVGCGVRVEREADGAVTVRGDPDHPANRGRLCSKGAALAETLGLEGRLLHPRVRGREASWDEALDAVARGLGECLSRHGPDSVALYVSGQLLTEDYYLANKFAKGYLGTANIDTNSRLCMSSAVAGHQRAFGEDLVPLGYEDLEQAELVVLVGSNLAWCHPVLMQRLLAARETSGLPRLVVIDPRRTATADTAELHLPLRPGTDVLLFNGLLCWLHAQGNVDAAFVTAHTSGLDDALSAAGLASADVDATAQACGLAAEQVQAFFELFASCERVVTAFSQGVNQSSAGTDKVNAIINCHLATGRIGRPGMGPFSLTGQPNAMGGREVGGLSTQLAAHLSLEEPAHREAVQRFWNSPRLAARAGLKAVELFEAVDAGRVRAVWIMATNPVVSLPDADVVRRALGRCELVIVSDCVGGTDTAALAHVLLPAAAWGEKEGSVTNSERCVSRQRAFLPLPGEARPDWWIIAQVARRMGFGAGFGHADAAAIFDEHARLARVAASLGRRLDLDSFTDLGAEGYASLEPRRWGPPQLFGDGRYATADGRARFVATPARPPRHATSGEFPLVLNTGRTRDQWHTMTRSGRAPQLNAHEPEPWVDLHADDARLAGVEAGQLVRLVTRWGRLVARARCSGEVARGSVFTTLHWSDANAALARVGALVNPVVDPLSGEPEFKHTPVRVEPWVADWHGFLLTRDAACEVPADWWARTQGLRHVRCELAGRAARRPGGAWLRDSFLAPGDELLEFVDEARGAYRAVALRADRLLACLFIAPIARALPSRDWLSALFGRSGPLEEGDRQALLAGRAPGARPDPGPILCACFGVGRNVIVDAIARGCADEVALARELRAGSNCGSCRPEIARLISAARLDPA